MNSESVKFLGVNLDSALSFRGHINEIRAECFKLINIIKFLREIWWSSHPDTLITIYKSLIRSRIDHASFVYFLNAKHLMNKLESVQTRAIELAFGLRMSSPTGVGLTEAGIPYVRNRVAFLGKSHIVKIMSSRNHRSVPYIKEIARTLGYYIIITDLQKRISRNVSETS